MRQQNIFIFLLLLIISSCSPLYQGATKQSEGYSILISKEEMTLSLLDEKGESLREFGVACGAAYGNKIRPGDMKTPEGEFTVSEVCDAKPWTHDFGDGKGEIKGAYGAYFIRLLTPPHTGIGIHGTHAPESIGTRASEGCIRLKNRNLRKLISYIYIGMPVTITPSEEDLVVATE